MNFENNSVRVSEKTHNAILSKKNSRTIIAGLMLLSIAFVMTILTSTAQARSLPDFTELVEEHSAAVVNISTTQKMKHPKTSRMPRGLPEQIPEDH